MSEEKTNTVVETLPPTLTVKALGRLLGYSEGHILNMRAYDLTHPEREPQLPRGHKLGRRVVYITSEVMDWLRER